MTQRIKKLIDRHERPASLDEEVSGQIIYFKSRYEYYLSLLDLPKLSDASIYLERTRRQIEKLDILSNKGCISPNLLSHLLSLGKEKHQVRTQKLLEAHRRGDDIASEIDKIVDDERKQDRLIEQWLDMTQQIIDKIKYSRIKAPQRSSWAYMYLKTRDTHYLNPFDDHLTPITALICFDIYEECQLLGIKIGWSNDLDTHPEGSRAVGYAQFVLETLDIRHPKTGRSFEPDQIIALWQRYMNRSHSGPIHESPQRQGKK